MNSLKTHWIFLIVYLGDSNTILCFKNICLDGCLSYLIILTIIIIVFIFKVNIIDM